MLLVSEKHNVHAKYYRKNITFFQTFFCFQISVYAEEEVKVDNLD